MTLSLFRIVACAMLATALAGCAKKERCKALEVRFVGTHEHGASVSPEKVKRGAGGTYRAHGAGHDHAFVLSDADMQTLGRGEMVLTRTSSTNAHVHEVTVRCTE